MSTGALDSPQDLAAAARDAAATGPAVGPLPPIRLGPLVVDPPLFLAPMAGFTNVAFRRVVRRLGCPLAATEMVMAEGVVRGHPRTLELAALADDERPGVVQIAGSDPAVMGEAAARLVDLGADAIDVNMGCPVRKIVDRCAGSALLREPSRAAGIVEGIRRRVGVPVTVKIRAGWDDASQSVGVARALESAGAAAVAVHGRTREQGYSGRASREAIRAVKEAVSIPVIGNGDVISPRDVLDMVRETGCDGVMIGRAALWDPWIFASAARALAEGRPADPPSPAERRALLWEVFRETAERRGERLAVLQMRKFASLYLRGFAGARRLRERIQTMDTGADVASILEGVFADGAPLGAPALESLAE